MRFEIWKDGERKFYTECKSCIPSEARLKEMKKYGYKIKNVNADGKRAAADGKSRQNIKRKGNAKRKPNHT